MWQPIGSMSRSSMRNNWLVLEATSKVSALEVLPKTDEDKFEITRGVVSS